MSATHRRANSTEVIACSMALGYRAIDPEAITICNSDEAETEIDKK